MIEMFNVSARYSEKYTGVQNVSLNIERGNFVFLLGPSGAGKSTIMRLIYMEILPTEGQVIVGEFNSSRIKRKQIPYLRRKTGIVFQDFQLFDDRTVYENVAFVLHVTGKKRKEIKRKVLRALADVGLSHKKGKYPMELSGGEKQRVTIARAIVNEPIIVLADEPTGNLDPQTSIEILELLQKINQKGTSVLMATHDYALVERYPQARKINLEQGKIVS